MNRKNKVIEGGHMAVCCPSDSSVLLQDPECPLAPACWVLISSASLVFQCVQAASQELGATGNSRLFISNVACKWLYLECHSTVEGNPYPWHPAPFQIYREPEAQLLKCFSKVSVLISTWQKHLQTGGHLGLGVMLLQLYQPQEWSCRWFHWTSQAGIVCCSFHLDSAHVEGPLVWMASQWEIKLSCP